MCIWKAKAPCGRHRFSRNLSCHPIWQLGRDEVRLARIRVEDAGLWGALERCFGSNFQGWSMLELYRQTLWETQNTSNVSQWCQDLIGLPLRWGRAPQWGTYNWIQNFCFKTAQHQEDCWRDSCSSDTKSIAMAKYFVVKFKLNLSSNFIQYTAVVLHKLGLVSSPEYLPCWLSSKCSAQVAATFFHITCKMQRTLSVPSRGRTTCGNMAKTLEPWFETWLPDIN